VTSEVSKLKDYLVANPLKDIDITGYYRSDETNNSAYPNLGLARANAVKNYLISQGVPSRQIDTHGQLNDHINPDDASTLFGPLKFGIVTFEEGATDEALETACEGIRKNPLVLYFKTGEAQINLSVEQRQKIADMSRCVDKLGVKVQVVGHTDNTGDAENNVILGQQRADFAKSYLIRNGILYENIDATSKGQIEPIADNNTDEGKAKNRRTVITIN
jgi:outer membrane protein OmpA-like peptidoglycan-associated protein